MDRQKRLEKLLRRLRSLDELWEDTPKAQKISQTIKKVKDRLAPYWEARQAATGPYSGLTRRELAASGTCETDWY